MSTERQSADLGQLFCALAQAQGEFPTVGKDRTAEVKTKTGGKYTYDYATLAAVQAAVRGPLAKAKLAIVQRTRQDNDALVLETVLGHESGQWLSSEMRLPRAGDERMSAVQALGGMITFCKRYALCSILCVSSGDEDNDGAEHDGGGRPPPPRVERPAQRAAPPPAEDTDVPFDVGPNDPPSRSTPVARRPHPDEDILREVLGAIAGHTTVSDVLTDVANAETLPLAASSMVCVRKAAATQMFAVATSVPELASAREKVLEMLPMAEHRDWHNGIADAYKQRRAALTGAK